MNTETGPIPVSSISSQLEELRFKHAEICKAIAALELLERMREVRKDRR